jgi:hypothetical protein
VAAVADGPRRRHPRDAAGERPHGDRSGHRHFHRPVFVGDEVTCYAEIIKIGTTSITVKVESWARRGTGEEQVAVTEGIFTTSPLVRTAGLARFRPKVDWIAT